MKKYSRLEIDNIPLGLKSRKKKRHVHDRGTKEEIIVRIQKLHKFLATVLEAPGYYASRGLTNGEPQKANIMKSLAALTECVFRDKKERALLFTKNILAMATKLSDKPVGRMVIDEMKFIQRMILALL